MCACLLLFHFSTPAYDHAPNPDKQWILRVTQPMKPIHRRFTDLLMTKRLQTLQSVDAAVERIFLVSFTFWYQIYNLYLFDIFVGIKKFR